MGHQRFLSDRIDGQGEAAAAYQGVCSTPDQNLSHVLLVFAERQLQIGELHPLRWGGLIGKVAIEVAVVFDLLLLLHSERGTPGESDSDLRYCCAMLGRPPTASSLAKHSVTLSRVLTSCQGLSSYMHDTCEVQQAV